MKHVNRGPSDQELSARAVLIIQRLEKSTEGMVKPMVFLIAQQFGSAPFLMLISCLLSLRTKDTITFPVCQQLFAKAQTPSEILAIPLEPLEKIIHPVGFFRKKARILHEVSQTLLDKFDGKVPHTLQELLSIKGVGLKTANLVLGEGFGIPAICVDTHVHKISNRLGLVCTKSPDETEEALKKIIPKEYWITYNRLLVMWGQNICVPVSPFCSKCAISDLCPRVGVKKSR